MRTTLLCEIDGKSTIVAREGAGHYSDSMQHRLNDASVIDGETGALNVDKVTLALEAKGMPVRIG